MSEIVRAPWDDRQIEMIRWHQHSGMMHAYTCGGDHSEAAVLHVTPSGMVCPMGCGYRQDWCHEFTVQVKQPETVYWQGIGRDVYYHE